MPIAFASSIVDGKELYNAQAGVCSPVYQAPQIAEVTDTPALFRAQREERDYHAGHLHVVLRQCRSRGVDDCLAIGRIDRGKKAVLTILPNGMTVPVVDKNELVVKPLGRDVFVEQRKSPSAVVNIAPYHCMLRIPVAGGFAAAAKVYVAARRRHIVGKGNDGVGEIDSLVGLFVSMERLDDIGLGRAVEIILAHVAVPNGLDGNVRSVLKQ